MGTVSPIELAWIAGALHGSWYALRNLRNAREQRRALIRRGENGDLAILSDQTIRNQNGRLSSLIACLVVGVISLTLPNQPGPFSIPRLVIAVCIFYIEYRLVWDSRGDAKDTDLLLEVRQSRSQNQRHDDPAV